MLKPIINPISRTILKKNSINHSLRISNHLLRNGIKFPTRCMASMNESEGNSENILPVFPTKQEIANARRTLFSDFRLDHTNDSLEEEQDMIYEREFDDIKVEDFEKLYENDATGSIKSQIENILTEYEYMKYNSMGRVPSEILCIDMERLIQEGTTPTARQKLFNFFFKREMAKRCGNMKRQKERAEKKAELDEKHAELEKLYGEKLRTGLLTSKKDLIYGLWHNSLFCRIPENRLKQAGSENRLIEAALFGRKLVFDFDFEDCMTTQTSRSIMEQVQEAYGLNRLRHQEPFDLWFCNFDRNSSYGSFMEQKCIKNLYNGSMITVKNDCFTNHFDKSRLVYLSPNAKLTVADERFDNDDIYIIGVYNDKGGSKPLTYRKAEALGIRSRSLPLDNFVAWQSGSKSLCLNHVTGIMLEVMSNGGDWHKAFLKCIPPRKIKPLELVMEEEERRLARRKRRFSIRSDFEF